MFRVLYFCKKVFSLFFLYLLEKRYKKKGRRYTPEIYHTGFLTRT